MLRRMQFGASEKLDQQIKQPELQRENPEEEERIAEAQAPAEVALRKNTDASAATTFAT